MTYSGTYPRFSVNGFDGSNITLNGGSSINFVGGSYNNKYDNHRVGGIQGFGEKIKITLNGESAVNVTGTGSGVENDYYGVLLEGTAKSTANRNTVTLNGGSSINVERNGTNTAGSLIGIRSYANSDDKYAADITLNNSSVNVSGSGVSQGEKYAGVLSIGGADAHVTLNASQISVTGESANDDNKYAGIAVFQQNLSNTAIGGIALKNGSSVTVNAYGDGADAKVYGVVIAGTNQDFKLGHITLDGGSTITLNSDVASSNMIGIGAKGYAPVIELNGGSSVTINAHGEGTNGKYIGITAFDLPNTRTKPVTSRSMRDQASTYRVRALRSRNMSAFSTSALTAQTNMPVPSRSMTAPSISIGAATASKINMSASSRSAAAIRSR